MSLSRYDCGSDTKPLERTRIGGLFFPLAGGADLDLRREPISGSIDLSTRLTIPPDDDADNVCVPGVPWSGGIHVMRPSTGGGAPDCFEGDRKFDGSKGIIGGMPGGRVYNM